MASIEFDISEFLQEADTDDLVDELARRNDLRQPSMHSGALQWEGPGLAQDLRQAFYRRDASEFERLLRAMDRYGWWPATRVRTPAKPELL
jgi:hypothetical protein